MTEENQKQDKQNQENLVSENEQTNTSSAEPKRQNSETVELKREEYEDLLKKINEFNTAQDRLLRSAADFDNAKKRLVKERDDFFKYALEGIIFDFLPVMDNFERAVSHLNMNDEKTKPVFEGFRLIHKQLAGVLNERGLKKLEAIGKPFDPHVHESVGYVVTKDQPEGIILEELVAGYELNGKLIRPAKVKLSSKEPVNQAAGPEKEEELT